MSAVGRAVDRPVVGVAIPVHNKLLKLPDTLLGFETTGPCPLRGVAPRWGCRRVVASLWWWGVVFDLWIVVASIWHARIGCHSVRGGAGLLCVDVQFL